MPVRFANVDHILAAAQSTEETSDAIWQMTAVPRERHRSCPGVPNDFSIRDMAEMTKVLSSTMTLMTDL